MKASDEPGPIRTLPPVMPDAHPGTAERAHPPPDRRWVPLAVVAVAVAVFAAVGVFDGASDPGGADARTDATVPSMAAEPVPTTVPPDPPLEQVVPGLAYNPTIVYRPDDDRTAWATWLRSSPVPTSSVTWGGNSTVVDIDASGGLLMAVTDDGTQTLWVGGVPNVVPAFIDVRGASWHPTEPGRVAFVGRETGANRYHLYTAAGLPPGGIADLVDLGPVSGRSELLAWGPWGFALSQLVEPDLRLWEVPSVDGAPMGRELLHITQILDVDGKPWRSVPGVPEAVGPNGELVVQPRNGAYLAAIAAGHTPAELGFRGEVVLVGERDIGRSVAAVVGHDLTATNARFYLDEADLANGDREFMFTPDGTAVTMVNHLEVTTLDDVDERIEVTTAHLHSNSAIRTVVDANRPIGFSRDGTYLITQDDSSDDIVLLDWNRGSTIRLPFGLGRVLVFDI